MAGKGANYLEIFGNRPFVISLLYCATFFTGITGLVGVVLAYLFRNSAQDEWEASHYPYLIRTFWIFVLAVLLAIAALIAIIANHAVGFLLVVFAGMLVVLCGVRAVISLVHAALEKAIPDPRTWLV
jgi:uncharacterized membrane protein